jgi:tetratricopeptide (TPR) repeat protein
MTTATSSAAAAAARSHLAASFAALPSGQRFNAEQCEVVHRLAYSALAAGEWASAHKYYEWLVVYSGADVRAWRGLAASAHAMAAYGQALMAWSMVTMLDADAVDATLYAGRCQALLGEVAEALDTFGLVARHPGADAGLRAQAQQMIKLLQQRAA